MKKLIKKTSFFRGFHPSFFSQKLQLPCI